LESTSAGKQRQPRSQPFSRPTSHGPTSQELSSVNDRFTLAQMTCSRTRKGPSWRR
jgi:hypothetical protein